MSPPLPPENFNHTLIMPLVYDQNFYGGGVVDGEEEYQ